VSLDKLTQVQNDRNKS